MKEMMRYGLTLSLICIIAGGLLSGANSLTKSRIIAQAKAEEEAGLKEVLPEGMRFEEVKTTDEIIYYPAYDKDNKFLGIAFKVSAKGYSSVIEAVVGMGKDRRITAIKILNQNETPGLGSRVSEPAFTGQFINKDTTALAEVQAITGATISSRAVIDSVKAKAQQIQEIIRNLPKSQLPRNE